MPDTPAHGPDGSTPAPTDPDSKRRRKRRRKARKGRRQHTDPAGDTTATPRARKSARGRGNTSGKNPHTPRGKAADVEHLTNIVYERLLLGEQRRDILRYLANLARHPEPAHRLKWPKKEGPSSRTVDGYIARATAEIRKLSIVERETARADARGRFLLVIRKAHDAGDMGTVRLATRDLARIDGLEPVRVQHSGSVITEHTGTVQHEHTPAKPASLEETAAAVVELLTRANTRMRAVGGVPPIAAPSPN